MTETYADQRAHDVAWMTAAERNELDRPKYAVEAPARGWRWTYSNITEAEAQEIAARLTAGSDETWTVREIYPACEVCGADIWICPGHPADEDEPSEDRSTWGPCGTCGQVKPPEHAMWCDWTPN